MPRELVHWDVLDQTVKLLPMTAVGRICSEQHALALIGAMSPDAPYYHRLGRSDFEETGELFHGAEGQDTFDFVRRMAKQILVVEECAARAEGWAFLLGYVSHCIVDAHFHPAIYSLTGDYYHEDRVERVAARARHRLFETYLDNLWQVLPETDLNRCKLTSLVDSTSPILPDLLQILSGSEVQSFGDLWSQSIKDMAFCQSAFTNLWIAVPFRILANLLPSRLADKDALFNFRRSASSLAFRREFYFVDPVSGEKVSTDFARLRKAAIDELLKVYQIFERVINTQDLELLNTLAGRSLNSGRYRSHKSEMRHFSVLSSAKIGDFFKGKGS